MKKLCVAVVGVLLLAFHLTSQVVLANNCTIPGKAKNCTHPDNTNITTTGSTGSGAGTPAAFTLMLSPLALSALLLHSWF